MFNRNMAAVLCATLGLFLASAQNFVVNHEPNSAARVQLASVPGPPIPDPWLQLASVPGPPIPDPWLELASVPGPPIPDPWLELASVPGPPIPDPWFHDPEFKMLPQPAWQLLFSCPAPLHDWRWRLANVIWLGF